MDEYSDKELEEILDRVYEWGIEFSKSNYFEKLTEEQRETSEFVVMSFTEYMYSYHGLAPEEWDEETLEECCLYTLPRKVTAEESYFRSIAPVLSVFFLFTGEKGLLKNSLSLAKKVRNISRQIIKNASDPRNWGMAKTFLMVAKDAGVNIHDENELNTFLMAYNLQQLRRKPIKRKIKVGRNDPCPCGSGKKYKKCCGKYV